MRIAAERVFDVADNVAVPPTSPKAGVAPRGGPLQRVVASRQNGCRGSARTARAQRRGANGCSGRAGHAARGGAVANATEGVRSGEGDRRIRLEPEDLRFKVRVTPVGALTVFVVDASGSMAARRRMALAKGAVLSLLQRAYQTRDEVALIAFRGTAADVLLPPTSSVHLASVRLRALPTGGRTPLALALSRAGALFAQRHASGGPRTTVPTLVLVSDGRANVALTDGDPYADALAQARLLRAAGIGAVVVDAEEGPVRLGRARTLALELGADYVRPGEMA